MADDELVFQAGAFSVVSSWLLGGDNGEDNNQEEDPRAGRERRPVQLYRSAGANDKPSLSGRSFGGGDGLTEEQRELKRKVLRRPSGGGGGAYRSTAERVAASAKQAEEESGKALDKEEQELVRYKAAALSTVSVAVDGDVDAVDKAVNETAGKKRKLTAQEQLLESLREEAARKKAKNLKNKLRQQRKKHKQTQSDNQQ